MPSPASSVLLLAAVVSSVAGSARAEGAAAQALRGAGIVLLPASGPGDAPVDEALAAELWAGFLALPEPARAFPGGPLELRLRAAPAPLGMGDGSRARPEWEAGQRRFLLYRYQPPEDDLRASYRLEGLDPAERERLWRRRALVHAVMARWDDAQRWSRQPAFRRLTGWQSAGRAGNDWAWAYSRARGRDSAALDLVTFAEEALVPAEALRDEALDPDNRVACQEFGKARFLAGVLHALGGQPAPARAQDCPAFEQWADRRSFSHHEVLFSAPSAARPQSAFGHLMLQPVYRPGGDRGFEPVYEVAAATGFGDNPLKFAWKGLFGGYQNIFEQISVAAVRADHVTADQRTVRRFRLRLSPQEEERLLERLWELERRGYFPYWFFSDNCATFTARAIQSALEDGARVSLPFPPVLPAGVLDALAGADLLEEGEEALRSGRERAVEAERAQARAISHLRAAVPALAAEWRDFQRASRSRENEQRRAAHARLPGLVARSLAQAPEAIRLWARVATEATVAMERYAAERADNALRALDRARIERLPDGVLPTADQWVAQRRREHQLERGRDGLLARVRRLVDLARLLDEAPRRPLTAREERARDEALATRRVFFDLVRVHGDLHEAHFLLAAAPAPAPGPPLGGVQRSGLGPFSIGVGTRLDGSGDGPVMTWSSAFLRERFGERRQHGMNPLMEARVLDSHVHLGLALPRPKLVRVDVYVAALWSLPSEPELTRSRFPGGLGFGGEYRLLRRESVVDAMHQLRGGLLVDLVGLASDPSHLLLYAGPELRAWSDLRPLGLAAGGFARLTGRVGLPGSAVNGLRVSLAWSPAYALWRPGRPGLGHEVEAEALFQVARGQGRPWGLDAGGWFELEADGGGRRVAGGLRALVKLR